MAELFLDSLLAGIAVAGLGMLGLRLLRGIGVPVPLRRPQLRRLHCVRVIELPRDDS